MLPISVIRSALYEAPPDHRPFRARSGLISRVQSRAVCRPENKENPALAFTYQSGEEIKKGDRVLFHGEPGEIEFVADTLIGDPAMDWYVEEHGGDVMVIETKYFGQAFLTETQTAEDLVFVSRAEDRKLK